MALLSRRVARRRRALCLAVRLGLLLLAVTRLTACFNPARPGCAFSCAGDGLCPSGYSCGTDQICHRDDGLGACLLGDAAVPSDAAPSDAARDASGAQ
jgi:hypothetical protein